MKNLQYYETIFVDCFNTVILRDVKSKVIFKEWAEDLSKKFNIPSKVLYKKFKLINFNMCFKKLFLSFTLQEEFLNVLTKLFEKLSKTYKILEKSTFIDTSNEIYIQKELQHFKINQKLIDFLKNEKRLGKKVYLVSDFYCKSNTLKYWFKHLNIDDVFNNIFSSADFNKEKATGKLYKELIKMLNLDAKKIIMFGDNYWSDILMARAKKLKAQKITIKHQGEKYEK